MEKIETEKQKELVVLPITQDNFLHKSSAVFTFPVLFKEPRTGVETNSEFEYSHPMWVLSHWYDLKSTEKF